MQYHQSVCFRWMCQALAVPGYISEWLHWPKCPKNSSVSRMISRKKPRSSVWVTSCLITTPSIIGLVLVGAVSAYEVIYLVVGINGLAGVPPEALDDVVFHRPPGDVVVVDIRYLQLTPI